MQKQKLKQQYHQQSTTITTCQCLLAASTQSGKNMSPLSSAKLKQQHYQQSTTKITTTACQFLLAASTHAGKEHTNSLSLSGSSMLEICEFVTKMSLAFVYRIAVGAILSFYLTSLILIVTEASLFLELSLAFALFGHMSSSMSRPI